tara:strand:- start:91 stop:1374 length:1284 start_codon:yes stop_codon:yes gene_type:complete
MADETSIQESAQALFISLADGFGTAKAKQEFDWKTKYPTYEAFKYKNNESIKKAFGYVNSVGVTLDNIDKYLLQKKNLDWYKSCINTGLALITDITTIDKDFAKLQPKGWKDIWYYRAGSSGDNVMNNIATLFSIANKNQSVFGQINKWSSADIYLSSSKGKSKIKEELQIASSIKYNFTNLNELISKLIDSGDLLGVSLKKSPAVTHLYPVNFSMTANEKLLMSVKYHHIKSNNPRDMQIFFGQNGENHFKIRHDPYSENLGVNLAIKVEVVGKYSRLGSLASFGKASPSGVGLTDHWLKVDSSVATSLANSFKAGTKKYEMGINKLNIEYSKMIGKPNLKGKELKKELKNNKSPKNKTKTLYDQYQDDRIVLSQKYIVDSYKKKIVDFFKATGPKNDMKKTNLIREWFRYTSAMNIGSGKFIIAK